MTDGPAPDRADDLARQGDHTQGDQKHAGGGIAVGKLIRLAPFEGLPALRRGDQGRKNIRPRHQ